LIFLHGYEAPGVVVVLPVMRRGDQRTVSFGICPRFPASKLAPEGSDHAYFLENPFAQPVLVQAELSGQVELQHLSGLGEGRAEIEIRPVGAVAQPRVASLSVAMQDPVLRLPYQPEGALAPYSAELQLDAGSELHAGLQYRTLQTTAIGDSRRYTLTVAVTLEELILPENAPVDYSGTKVGLGPGPCYALLFNRQRAVELAPRSENVHTQGES
jgi:hypothetical protein